jgi:hypothetical protein
VGMAWVCAAGAPAAALELISGSPTWCAPLLASPLDASGAPECETEGSFSPAFLAFCFSLFFWLFERPLLSDPAGAAEPATGIEKFNGARREGHLERLQR